jgi:hypothetical protein
MALRKQEHSNSNNSSNNNNGNNGNSGNRSDVTGTGAVGFSSGDVMTSPVLSPAQPPSLRNYLSSYGYGYGGSPVGSPEPNREHKAPGPAAVAAAVAAAVPSAGVGTARQYQHSAGVHRNQPANFPVHVPSQYRSNGQNDDQDVSGNQAPSSPIPSSAANGTLALAGGGANGAVTPLTAARSSVQRLNRLSADLSRLSVKLDNFDARVGK